MATRSLGVPLLAGLFLGLVAGRAQAALPNCEPRTVLQAASGERQAMLLHALDFYSFYPGYSETACVNVVTGAKKGTSGSYSGGCAAASDWWRTDCSGYASFVWGLAKSYNCKGLSTKGTDAAGHSWTSKAYAELEPGDALNKTDQHVMIFTGWLDAAHTKICTIQELNPTQADHDGVIGCTTWPWKVADLQSTSPAYVPIALTDTSRFNPNPRQSSANDFISLVSWPDGHVGAFARTTDGELVLSASASDGTWSKPETLGSGVACGSAVGYWPHILDWPNQADVFSPLTSGGASHTAWADGAWTKPAALGDRALSHFQSVVHFDGNLEVFALGADGAIYSNLGDRWTNTWSGWQSLGGSFGTGPSAIVWNDGHTELFATTASGEPQHNVTEGGAWKGWTSMQGTLRSRPVPVRWWDGHVEVFATGADAKLQRATNTAGTWSAFEVVDPTADIAGDPSAIMRPASKTANAGVEVFARSKSGQVLHLAWDGAKLGAFTTLQDQATLADPMGWVRKDGSVDVFALDAQHELVSAHFDGSTWSAWASLAASLDPCLPESDQGPVVLPTRPPSDGTGGVSAGPSAGGNAPTASDDSGSMTGGCGCSVPGGSDYTPRLSALLVALLFAAARRRR